MKVQIHLLRRAPALSARLKRDGWRLDFESPESLIAHHRDVLDAEDARERLNRLGVLTSAALRIDFAPSESSAEPAVF